MSAAGSPAAADGSEDLLERGEELAALTALMEAAPAGRGGTLVLEGPPGIGKTTLLRRAAELAAGTGARTLRARGAELDHGLAFGVIRELLVPVVRENGPDRLLVGPAAAARGALGFGTATEGVEPAAVADAVQWLVTDLAEEGPLALLVDDFQWVDAASRQVLVRLCRRLEDLPVVAVLAMRPDANAALELDPVLREPATRELRPAPLSVDAVADLARRRFGSRAEGAFSKACHEVSGGVPFLVGELLGEMHADGIEPTEAAAGTVRALAPRAVSRSVLVRVAKLGDEAAALARAVATFPVPTPLAHSLAVAGLDPASGPALLRRLLAEHVLVCDPHPDFVHPVMRTAVYEDMTPHERALAHGRAAHVLGDAGAPAEETAAHHLHTAPEGNVPVRDVLHQAGSAALRAGAADAAVRYLSRAAEETRERSAALLSELGRAEAATGLPTASATMRAAYEAARDPYERGRIAGDLAELMALVDLKPEEAAELLWQAIDELPERDDLRLSLLARIYLIGNRFTTIDDHQVRALRQMPPDLAGNTPAERACLLAQRHDDTLYGSYRDSEEALTRVLANGRLVEEDAPGSMTPIYAAISLRIGGKLRASSDLSTQVIERASMAGRRGSVALAHVLRASTLFRMGRLVEAEPDARTAYSFEGVGAQEQAAAGGWLVRILAEIGNLDEAQAVADSVEPPPGSYAIAILDIGRAVLARARGDMEGCIAAYERAREPIRAATFLNPANAEWGHDLAVALTAVGRHDEADEILRPLEERARAFEVPVAIGWLQAARGVVTGGDEGAAILREAVAILGASEFGLEHMRALSYLGSVLRRAGRPREAREPLREALDLARVAGARTLERTIEDELRAAGGRAVAKALSGAESLTPSERRIARLAADGLTNREIAQQLYLTPKTIEMHLGNTYRKLDISSRRDLADALQA